MDVKALHANIPTNEGIAAVKRKHGNYTKKPVATKVITKLLGDSSISRPFLFHPLLNVSYHKF